MVLLITCLLLLAAGTLLLLGLLRVLHDWVEQNVPEGPTFHDQGPIFHDHGADREARSQFAWQSRSHFRAPD
jgi:hypothetical protein